MIAHALHHVAVSGTVVSVRKLAKKVASLNVFVPWQLALGIAEGGFATASVL